MIREHEVIDAKNRVRDILKKNNILISENEFKTMDVADFGLGNYKVEGAQMTTFFCTKRVSAKVIVLFSNQVLPEHWHTSVGGDIGKEETIRVLSGTLYLYTEGDTNIQVDGIPYENKEYYTCRKEHIMKAPDQITLKPGQKHWFRGGENGAVVFSFSTCAYDDLDPFTNPNIVRKTKIVK